MNMCHAAPLESEVMPAAAQMRIKSAAIMHNGVIHHGESHSEIGIQMIREGVCNCPYPTGDCQGFVTECGRYVTRKQALAIAIRSGQVKQGCTRYPHELYSADLPQSPTKLPISNPAPTLPAKPNAMSPEEYVRTIAAVTILLDLIERKVDQVKAEDGRSLHSAVAGLLRTALSYERKLLAELTDPKGMAASTAAALTEMLSRTPSSAAALLEGKEAS